MATRSESVATGTVRAAQRALSDYPRPFRMLPAKLGIATERNLPEVCRERFSRRTSLALWVQAEVIAMATDLAEFLGAALGFHLLLGIGLFPAALLTAAAAFAILG